MAQKNARTEPGWSDVSYWIAEVERGYNVRVIVSQELRAGGKADCPPVAVHVRAYSTGSGGQGLERAGKTGTFPAYGVRSMTGLVLNLLHQLDNQLAWEAADSMRETLGSPVA